jgi:hypothetical protein
MDEDRDDDREDRFGKRALVKVSLPGTVVATNVDTACWSIWLPPPDRLWDGF